MACSNSDILALIDYFENGTDLSNNDWDNYNYYDLWNALENGASPPSRTVCATFTQADILSVTLAVLGTFTTPSEYLGFNRDFYYLYLKAIGQEDPSPTFTNECIGALYDVFTVNTFTGLLDDYPGAAAAYSIRLLSSTYTGPLVQIRKQGDNAINSFYPDSNNELSLNSTDISGTSLSSWIGSENGFVRTWYDQSGNSNNATQTTAANQPQIINAGSLITDNGKASISFTGSESFGVSTISLTGDFAHFSVFNGTGFNYGSNYYLRYTGYLRYNGGTGVITSVNRNNLQTQCTWLRISNSVSNFYNGNTGNTGTDSTTFTSNFIGAYNGSIFWTGKQQEFVIYSTDQSSNRTGIETNINDFYSIY